MQSYTYTVRQISTGLWYYGVRKSSTFDLGTTYFTSSKLIKRLMEECGISDFEFKIRRSFDNYTDARKHETKVLQRLRVRTNSAMLNQAVSSPSVPLKDSESELRRRRSISEYATLKWSDPDFKHYFNTISIEDKSNQSRKGAQVRADKYKTGEIKPKVRVKKIYKDVDIQRNGIIKTVKRNQVPAYVRIGWTMT